MFSLRRPSLQDLRATLDAVGAEPFTYPEVGATRSEMLALPERRYDVDRHRLVLGRGQPLFERARSALWAWEHFSIAWLERIGPSHVQPDAVTGVLVHEAGLWSFNPCRVVYILDEDREPTRAAFAYGTLPGHAEIGEERFLLELSEDDGTVSFEILAFSRPAHPLSRIGRPLVRRLQRRFALASLQALRAAASSAL